MLLREPSVASPRQDSPPAPQPRYAASSVAHARRDDGPERADVIRGMEATRSSPAGRAVTDARRVPMQRRRSLWFTLRLAVGSWRGWASPWLRPSQPVGDRVPPWNPVFAKRRGRIGHRDVDAYQTVIDQFDVESNRRYLRNRAGRGETYCNIFVWDVTRAMRAELPHWVDQDGEPAAVHCGRETTANDVIEWLRVHGERFGWHHADVSGAQRYANRGCPVVAAWHNPGGIGHLAMMLPGSVDERGPLVAQCGEINGVRIRAADAFGAAWRKGDVIYFVHD